MTDEQRAFLLADFSIWSGGFHPSECDGQQLLDYVAYAMPGTYNPQEALAFLRDVQT